MEQKKKDVRIALERLMMEVDLSGQCASTRQSSWVEDNGLLFAAYFEEEVTDAQVLAFEAADSERRRQLAVEHLARMREFEQHAGHA